MYKRNEVSDIACSNTDTHGYKYKRQVGEKKSNSSGNSSGIIPTSKSNSAINVEQQQQFQQDISTVERAARRWSTGGGAGCSTSKNDTFEFEVSSLLVAVVFTRA